MVMKNLLKVVFILFNVIQMEICASLKYILPTVKIFKQKTWRITLFSFKMWLMQLLVSWLNLIFNI